MGIQQLIADKNWDELVRQAPYNQTDLLLLCNHFFDYHINYDHHVLMKVFDIVCPTTITADATFDQYLMHHAIENNDLVMIKRIITERPNVLLKKCASGWSSYLECAVGWSEHRKSTSRSTQLLHELLPHFYDTDGMAMLRALRNNDIDVAQMLVNKSNLRAEHSFVLQEALKQYNTEFVHLLSEHCLFAEAWYGLKHAPAYPAEKNEQDTIEVAISRLEQLIKGHQGDDAESVQDVSCQLWKAVNIQDQQLATYWLNVCDDKKIIYIMAYIALTLDNPVLAMPFLLKLKKLDVRIGMQMLNNMSEHDFCSLLNKMSDKTLQDIFVNCVFLGDHHSAKMMNDRTNIKRFYPNVLKDVAHGYELFRDEEDQNAKERLLWWFAQWQRDEIMNEIAMPDKDKDKKKI